MRGHFGIGIYYPKYNVNTGTLWRSAHIMGADYIFTVNRRFTHQKSDTTKAYKHIPMYYYEDWDKFVLPANTQLVGVETCGRDIKGFVHPERACYLLGAEDTGIPKKILDKCSHVIKLPGKYCLNVSVAGSLVLYDRMNK